MNQPYNIHTVSDWVEWGADVRQREQDEVELRMMELREEVSQTITCDDLLEEAATTWSEAEKAEFTEAVLRGHEIDETIVFALFDEAKERVLARKMRETQIQQRRAEER